MLSQSHSVNTSIESCTSHLLPKEESQSQSDKFAECERVLKHSGYMSGVELRVSP